jgi:outer membrane protein assembly factor BamB
VQPAYYITQLSANLQVEWKFQSTNTQSCSRNPDGSLHCVSDHPSGFEWCINAPAIDINGTVYANSEDGNLYTLPQGDSGVFTKPKQSIFLNLAIGAAYTPLSIGPDGRIYTENDGHMFVVGN